MRIAVYTPYLNTLGGGEKYMLTIAETLSEKEEVELLLGTHQLNQDIKIIKQKALELHGLDLSNITITEAPFWPGSSMVNRMKFLRKYDWLFYITDGSIFLSTAKNSIIHFQMPLDNIGAKSHWGRLKLKTWKKAIYNSKFTQQYIEQQWPITGEVVYPPVSIEYFKPLKKKKQIISVGRFFGYTKAKKHEVMIEAFKDLVNNHKLKEWSLHLAGGITEGDKEYVEQLKKMANGFPIHFYPDIKLEQLTELYGESMIYWHAMGYGEEDPQKFEHFGITTVEAMAAGCVPVVINKGGQPEIVNSECGFLWNSLEDLKMKTLSVIMMDKQRLNMSTHAIKRARDFDKEHFKKAIKRIVYGN